ncbi:M15 family metallopeptidase [Microbacterium sp. bgisy207]|jgi:LAS superfamily LD-carboxypeptidase LdcB|uniref:M15 family metallopeptidase n=1 Tax=Microbacterium sp. bgisy207 TaxID=3413800 RepID=UPI003EBF27F8
MGSSRKDRAIARRTFLGFAAAFTTAGVVGTITTDNAKARAAFDDALSAWTSAGEAMDASAASFSAAQSDAVTVAAEASRVLEVTDPEMIDDSATLDTLRASLDALVAAGLLTIVSPGEVTASPSEPEPRSTPAAPEGREAQLAQAQALSAQATRLADAAAGTERSVTELESAADTTRGRIEAVVAAAAAHGAAAEVPELATQETKDAYATALGALADPAAGSASDRISAYQSAWTAVEDSHAAAEAAQSRGGGSTDDDIQPTYVNGILIVNKTYRLPSWYGNGLTGDTLAAFERMRAEAASLGHNLWIASGFRSYSTQVSVYNSYASRDGSAAADRYSARPGHSEHQSGLAFDLNTITESFGYTPEGQWVAANAHRFGFIVRYPQGKEGVTGYIWEPWHLRYLGVDVATAVYNSGLSLEEYLGITSSYD